MWAFTNHAVKGSLKFTDAAHCDRLQRHMQRQDRQPRSLGDGILEELQSLGCNFCRIVLDHTGDVAFRMSQTRDNALPNRILDIHHDNGNFGSYLFGGQRCIVGGRHDDFDPRLYQLGHEVRVSIEVSLSKAALDDDVLAFNKSILAQTIQKGFACRLGRNGWVICQKTDVISFAAGLRTRHRRPRDRGAANERDELAAPHSITSLAVAMSFSGTSSPSAFAVLRLMTNSNLVGCWTGRSAGLSPLRMRST